MPSEICSCLIKYALPASLQLEIPPRLMNTAPVVLAQGCLCVCVCVCVHACMRACACVRVRAYVRVRACCMGVWPCVHVHNNDLMCVRVCVCMCESSGLQEAPF